MNIYKVKRHDTFEYDEYDGFVAYARTDKSVRNMHPSGDNKQWPDRCYAGWVKPAEKKDLIVTLIGENKEQKTQEIILASYNAG